METRDRNVFLRSLREVEPILRGEKPLRDATHRAIAEMKKYVNAKAKEIRLQGKQLKEQRKRIDAADSPEEKQRLLNGMDALCKTFWGVTKSEATAMIEPRAQKAKGCGMDHVAAKAAESGKL